MPPSDFKDCELLGRDAPGSPVNVDNTNHQTEPKVAAPFIEKQVTIDEAINVAIRFWGDESAAATCAPGDRYIAVHGFLDNAGTFDLVAPKMLERGAVAIACLDTVGHGWSDRRAPYRGMDWVMDLSKVADKLGWDTFSIVSHSLGGMTSLAFASLAPTRVCRLIVIEALGWMSQDVKGQLEMQQKAVAEPPKGKNIQTYPSLLAAAERRAEMNLVGKLPLDAATVLVQRGTTKTENGFVWASDPACLATHRETPSEEYIRAMLSQIKCPTLLVVADDGLWKKGAVFGTRLFSTRWYLTVYLVYFASLVHHLFTNWFTLPKGYYYPGMKAPAIRGMQFVYNLANRRRACKTMTVHNMKGGGHHPHLTQPEHVADAISQWVAGASTKLSTL